MLVMSTNDLEIGVVGAGYVGLVTAACLSIDYKVVCVDVDSRKIKDLNHGIIPFYEPTLEPLVKSSMKLHSLVFSEYLSDIRDCDVIFVCVGTPEGLQGAADITNVRKVVQELVTMTLDKCIIVIKSTVPPLTANTLQDETLQDGRISIISNPEFLREGNAVWDFKHPDRVVIGYRLENAEDKKAANVIGDMYIRAKIPSSHILYTDNASAELIKYASNCMLATRISFINEIANLCGEIDANIDDVAKGIGMDQRIGMMFLRAGIGYGGSCFPKDVNALIHCGNTYGIDMRIAQATRAVNNEQVNRFVSMIVGYFGDVANKTFAVWGIAFKPNTSDTRESPAKNIIHALGILGAYTKIHDPHAKATLRSQYEVLEDVDALLILTDCEEYITADLGLMRERMRDPIIFDGRNIYNVEKMTELGFTYIGIGKQNEYPNVLSSRWSGLPRLTSL